MLVTQDLKDFSITSWYKTFENVTIKTIILEVPVEVVKWFQFQELSEPDEECSAEEIEADSPEIEEDSSLSLDFKDKLKNVFNVLGQTLFIKNNWHAPLDAKMFSVGHTLKAECIEDIRLYLKTSSIIQQDFANIKEIPFCLAIRKWMCIHPAAEFRCIVVNNILRGITPRDWPTFYPHFKEDSAQIIQSLLEFFTEFVKLKFLRTNYIVDIVLSYPDKPFILDFGPLNRKTNLYAFTWKDIGPLLNKDVDKEVAPVFRYLDSDIGIMNRAHALLKFQQEQNATYT
ncbi:translation initiation factor eIF2 assembly protein-like [Euwallacea similis]|uniref:translation initiation factor eIF2 assembly protein-like n=1 Tax=Euwallacea similis TaxID=1736056 RepID=UPI0034504087